MLGSIGKGNLCLVVVCMAKTNNQQGYKASTTPQSQEIWNYCWRNKIKADSGNVAFIFLNL
jgi:hypothetical protein